MRWTWLIPRLLIVGAVWLAIAFGFDPMLRYSAIHGLQAVTGARADVDNLRTGFFPPVVDVSRVALASANRPGTNLVEFDALNCRLGGNALLHRNFVVEEASLHGVRFGSVREDDGQLEQSDQESSEPSWLTEKLREVGDEWLELLAGQAKEQLDPDRLETWRVSQELQEKWKQRLDELKAQVDGFKPQVERIQKDMDATKQLASIERIEKYIQLTGEGERLMREAGQIRNDLTGIIPEAREDFSRLDQARRNDQENVINTVQSLKPNPRRITESILGPELYLQLHQTLSWLQLGADYQKELRARAQPERYRGQDVVFPLLNPTPAFLCRRLEISGELVLQHDLTPFHAVLSDVTSDPAMLGLPSVLKLRTAGEQPLILAVRHDLTDSIPKTDIVAEFSCKEASHLTVGKESTAVLDAVLSDLQWSAQVRVAGEQLAGVVNVGAEIGGTEVHSSKMHPYLQNAVVSVFSGIQDVSASVQLSGTLKNPDVSIESNLGDQVAAGLSRALSTQAEQLKSTLMAEVSQIAQEQQQGLSQLVEEQYKKLMESHGETVRKIQGAQQLLAGMQNGKMNPQQAIRTVSESGLLSERDSEKAEREVKKAGQFLNGLRGIRR